MALIRIYDLSKPHSCVANREMFAAKTQLGYFTSFFQNGYFRMLTFKAVEIFHSLDQKVCISRCHTFKAVEIFHFLARAVTKVHITGLIQ